VGRILDPSLANESDEKAAEKSCEAIDFFLKKIGLWIGFKSLNVSQEEIRLIADHGHVLGDYKNNPSAATIDEMHNILIMSYERK
jgi:alcohol dehydrogenase class IV